MKIEPPGRQQENSLAVRKVSKEISQMPHNPLRRLQDFGQSIWLDFIKRGMLFSGELQRLIEEDGLRGVTSNPAIFEKAIAGSRDYDKAIRALALAGKSTEAIYQALTVEDVRRAADLFRPVYDRTDGRDGFVSLEVSPHLAYNTDGTIAEARRLWKALDRPNVLIKVPATREGLPAIRQLIAEGININVTLLFGLPRYREVAEVYIAGLEARAARGEPLRSVASVASFFLSRIDVLIDPMLDKVMQEGGSSLKGTVAIASARKAYQIYKEIFASERFRRLADLGARTQRLLWASTSTKNPAYSDVMYVDPLIGPDTVNTLPLETLSAYREHGQPAARLEEDLREADRVLRQLSEAGIDLDALTQQLEDEGVHKFIVPFDSLMAALEAKRAAALKEPVDRQTLSLGDASVVQRLADLEHQRFVERLWCKDPTLWKTDPESQKVILNALGWLDVAEKMVERLPEISGFVEEVKAAGFRHAVLLGMGGSSLAPMVFQCTFAPAPGSLPLTVLDTTDPATVLKIAGEVPLADTLFMVASKSGTTIEPQAFGDFFYGKLQSLKGDRAGENFVAITDPGKLLADQARERGFRRTFLNFPDIGGRYSALSYFGLVPIALMGIDISELLVRALRMVHACVPAQGNPGVVLGAAMGEMALQGRDKVTFLMPSQIAALGMWLEQLIAESTGKEGKGILPVEGEPLGDPSLYGDDRLFIHIRLKEAADEALERGLMALQEAGHPVITLQMEDRLDLGQEFFRWEVATATAGAILGINPFDQPNVQESKDNTTRLLKVLQEQGSLPEEKPTLTEGPLSLYSRQDALTMTKALKQFLSQARPGDYLAILAYLTEDPATQEALQSIRLRLRDTLHLAATTGFGPRFLHSTGQLHKGGPNTGLFVQLTADDPVDASVPGHPYTFGALKQAQALGDLEALHQHGRRAIRIHLGKKRAEGLAALKQAVEAALSGLTG